MNTNATTPTLNLRETHQYLKESAFENLFTQVLGWDHHTQTLNIIVDETEYRLTAIAEKRGMVVFECPTTATGGSTPDYATRRKIQKQVATSVHEHFIIYTDTEKTTQIWQWVKREQGKPDACREHRYDQTQSGESLIQKIQTIAFSFAEEAELTLLDVTGRVRASFDVEKVTKRFYDHFKKEHDAFLTFLKGIPDTEMQRWYVSVMLNRLMFIYFIEKKGFLDDNTDYLRTKLKESQTKGTNRYYREFLCPLFFEGFAKPEAERSQAVQRLLGEIPYLNGGIFQQHQLEVMHGDNIEIPDKAFEQIFNFFEQYQWHLDERALRKDNEINPDVLGYIFEKYINQKQMGAYYTKEDITEYISKNTIIPFLFDTAEKSCKIAFEADSAVWQLLQEDPGRYIYDAVKKGVAEELPPDIAAGIGDVSKRTAWNTLAPDKYALPTEIWREVIARRQRYETVYAKLANGEVRDINDLITYNLNIRQFTQDVIENCEGTELLRAFYKAITEVTILDPTCGSGAFLFAALNILEPLYEACLDRMQAFLDDSPLIRGAGGLESEVSPLIRGAGGLESEVSSLIRGAGGGRRYSDFRDILDRIKQHPNREYFVLKSIIINNLYGVDIMEEAVEICKLRLFLKMVAQLEDVKRIEPLPDIDFNIQAGNTLVGYATYNAVEKAVTGKLDFDDTMQRIQESAEDVDQLFTLFRQQQTELGGTVTPAEKQALQGKLSVLEAELNGYLAGEYKVDPNKKTDYQNWLTSHKPFHWFTAFYGILKTGGFDVIIGNPPYVEYSKVKKAYAIKAYETEKCGNLYAFVFERGFQLLQRNGWKSMIIPHSAYCTDRMGALQNLFHRSKQVGWVKTYGIRPSKLFVGADQRLAIYIVQQNTDSDHALYASHYNRWHEQFRSYLFSVTEHADVTNMSSQNSIPKIYGKIEQSLWEKLSQFSTLGTYLVKKQTPHVIYFHDSPRYWVRAMDFVPYFWNERDGEKIQVHVKRLNLTMELDTAVVMGALNSSLFYWWYIILSDCRSLTLRDIRNFPIGANEMDEVIKQHLSAVSGDLMRDLMQHAQRKQTHYKATGRVVYDEFYPRLSKSIIDEIDRLLAKHYGFTDEELDFIINYDVKYRMGLGN